MRKQQGIYIKQAIRTTNETKKQDGVCMKQEQAQNQTTSLHAGVAGVTPKKATAKECKTEKPRIGFISLGCPKNQVDTERMLYDVMQAGYPITPEESVADIVIINTCAFIQQAQKEAIDNILDVAWLKEHGHLRGIIVTGCLPQRYGEEVMKELPEVDAVLGVGSVHQIVPAIRALEAGQKGYARFDEMTPETLCGDRVITTPTEIAYLKISEGCDNRCAYCVIPSLRGKLQSRPMEELVEEAQGLDRLGVKELVLVAQDTTVWGRDLYGESRLVALIEEICAHTQIPWIRLLYCYPDKITDELVQAFRTNPRLLPYIDLPVQHLSDRILRAMHRKGDSEVIRDAVRRLRTVKGMVIRSTFITGFPGETEEDVQILLRGAQALRFDRLGVFPYSREEGTPAYDMPDQVDEQVKQDRADLVMGEQLLRCEEENQTLVGNTYAVLCEGFDVPSGMFFGRSYRDAYDIDGKMYFTCGKGQSRPQEGQFVPVKVTQVLDYDLIGESVGAPTSVPTMLFEEGSATADAI